MHRRVALATRVFGGRRRVDNGRIHNRARRDANAFRFQIPVHGIEHLAAQFVLFQKMTKAKDGRLVRRRGHAQIDSGKAAQHRRLVESLFHPRVRQAEPLLQKVGSEHDSQTHRLPPVARLRVVRLDQGL